MSIVLGIDIGGSGIKGAPVDTATGQLVGERLRIPTPAGARPDDVKGVVKQLVEHFGHAGPVGITFPGIVQGGVTLSAANVDEAWLGLDADALFTRETGRDVHLLNDADAAGLAEMRFGAGVGVGGTVLVLTFGTGIGSALIRDGQLVPNTELGHLWLREKHAEAWASASAREREDLGWKAWTKRVSAYLQHLELLFSPDLFIIGGGISKKADRWRDLIVLERSHLVPATLANDAGIVGAAMFAAGQMGRAPEMTVKGTPRPQRVASSATRSRAATEAEAGAGTTRKAGGQEGAPPKGKAATTGTTTKKTGSPALKPARKVPPATEIAAADAKAKGTSKGTSARKAGTVNISVESAPPDSQPAPRKRAATTGEASPSKASPSKARTSQAASSQASPARKTPAKSGKK